MVGAWFRQLLERTDASSHEFVPSTETFPPLDVERAAQKLGLAARGAARGAANEPPADAVEFDLVEREAVDFVDGNRERAEGQYRDMLNLYRDRLGDFALDTKAAQIGMVGDSGFASLTVEIEKALDGLNMARKDMIEAEEHLRRYRLLHKRDSPARYPRTTADKALRWSLLGLLLIAEGLMNGMFFAQGSDYGMAGGWSVAGFFALFNLAVAFFAGRYASTAVNRLEPFYRLLGWIGMAAYVAGTLALNLMIAHYRSASEAGASDPSGHALETLAQGAFFGQDLMSMALFGLGVVFSVIAFIDARGFGDPYLGYEIPAKAFEELREAYRGDRDDAGVTLEGIMLATIGEMKANHEDLGRRRGEGAAIHEAMARLGKTYEAELRALERHGNKLLSIYREANRQARTTPCPAHFARPWTMPRPEHAEIRPPRYSEAEIDRIIAAAKAELDSQMARLNKLFECAMERLRSLDSLDS